MASRTCSSLFLLAGSSLAFVAAAHAVQPSGQSVGQSVGQSRGQAFGQAAEVQPVNPAIVREGSGPRRSELNGKELAPFDATAWSKVSAWAGTAPAASDFSGQVVVICTWKYYHPVSKRAMETARRIAEQNAGKGVVVVAVHDSQNWEEAQKAATAPENKEARFFVGFDEKGEFRKAIGSDGDPDFYVIDRSGQLRYADIATESVDAAVKELAAETADAALSIKDNLAKEADKRNREAAKTNQARSSFDMSSIPALPPGYKAPAPELYMNGWAPTLFQKMTDQPSSSSSNEPKPTPVLQLPEGEGWIGKRPELQGRVWVVYFWSFDDYRSYSIMQEMDQLQKASGRDIAVVGVATIFPKSNSGYEEPKVEDPAKTLERISQFARGKALQHSTFVEPSGQLFTATRGDMGSDGIPIPYAVVCSSDGSVRFSGWAKHPSFKTTIQQTLLKDPGVRARRVADEEYIKSKSK
jgi:cytochrome c biogenesis protein CcmG/thiol:disulfide interchange protein DsbE